MTKRRVMLSFTPETIAEPIIYTISQQFNLATNIRRADLAEDRGWIIVEFEGDEKNIEDGIAWAISKGVRVDEVSEET
jgi:ABC-type methionine transport system ATPase subunit